MILVAGGQLDPNIGRLLRQLIYYGVPFKDLIVGPDCTPSIALDLSDLTLKVDGELTCPSSAFVRHDVFWPQRVQDVSSLPAVALNWFYAVRGWMLANEGIRCFNRFSYSSENNKIYNLNLARKCGLRVCDTLIATLSSDEVARYSDLEAIVKPVAGGSLTVKIKDALDFAKEESREGYYVDYPRFFQERLIRPEVRIFGVGDHVVSFSILSEDLDYREHHQAKIELIDSPAHIVPALKELAKCLGLTFFAADFMLDSERNLVFLEINTQPMFATFDALSEGLITNALIHFLEPKIAKMNDVPRCINR